MSEAFGASALRLAGMAGATLGWTPDVFWRATPAELAAVVTALTGEAGGGAPPDAALLARLKEAFPDG
ncbi:MULTISPECIES: phage tail assembly chaperone [unclassified Sphingomonas]|uniref:phage tail assembly chaperone n=1 Tax=unclassified Sphingomonas TaxID=196159 RepID=UPI00226ACD61|nr:MULTISPECIES: phage tail assembly chaperone [unclassified Sphingomonas]